MTKKGEAVRWQRGGSVCTHPSNTSAGPAAPWVRYVIGRQSILVPSGSSTFVDGLRVHSTRSLDINSHHSTGSLGQAAAPVLPQLHTCFSQGPLALYASKSLSRRVTLHVLHGLTDSG